jgi:type IV pilus assembly protein PilM
MAEGKHLVGVDIGASAIKVVQLRETRRELTVVRWGVEPLPPQTLVDGHVINSGAVIEGLARVFRDQNITQRDVALGVYGQSVIVRKITVPVMTPAELEEQIYWEAEQHIPFDIKLMSVDYEVLRRRPEAGQMDLLLVAAKRDEISDYAGLVREAKLRPAVVDLNAFAVQNVFERVHGPPAGATIALLNVGAAVSTLNIVSDGVSAFTREITHAGGAITEEIRRQCNCSYEQAEAMKCGRLAGANGPELLAIIIQACAGLSGEIQRSLDFFLATSGEREISRIYLSGGSAYLAPLAQAIERRARVPVQIFDPSGGFAVDSSTVDERPFRGTASQMVVALGLGLRREKERRTWSA